MSQTYIVVDRPKKLVRVFNPVIEVDHLLNT